MTHTVSVRRLLTTAAIAATIPLAACSSSTPPPAAGTSSSSTPPTSTSTSTTASEGDAAYCEALKSGQKELEGISAKLTDQAALQQALAALEKIKDAAPAEVEQAWSDFIEFVDSAASGNQGAMTSALQKMQAAGTKIEQHAKATCNLDMS